MFFHFHLVNRREADQSQTTSSKVVYIVQRKRPFSIDLGFETLPTERILDLTRVHNVVTGGGVWPDGSLAKRTSTELQ